MCVCMCAWVFPYMHVQVGITGCKRIVAQSDAPVLWHAISIKKQK